MVLFLFNNCKVPDSWPSFVSRSVSAITGGLDFSGIPTSAFRRVHSNAHIHITASDGSADSASIIVPTVVNGPYSGIFLADATKGVA